MESTPDRILQILPSDTDDITCLTLILKNEDHTLGNALRYVIAKNPAVTFCGYGVPHPSDQKIHLRIQTNGVAAADVFKKGLEDLQKICDIVTEKFEKAHKEYEEAKEMARLNQEMGDIHADD